MAATDIFHHAHIGEGELLLTDDSLKATVPAAVQHRIEDWLALELTAERMAQDELLLVRNYVASDVDDFVSDVKVGWRAWELGALSFLLEAADPTLVEWQEAHWWDGPEENLH